MRHELLAIEQFVTLLEAKMLTAHWRIEYNTYRPTALGLLPSARVRAAVESNQQALRVPKGGLGAEAGQPVVHRGP